MHGDVEEDVARVKAIRERVGDDAHLTIDANQSYSPKDAITAINRMAEYRLDLVEQPVSRDDLKGLALVTRSVPVTVEADEGAGTFDEIMTLVSKRIVDAVSLKIQKLGGLRNALAAARICEAGHVKYRLGAHVGTRLGNAHAIHLAAALPGVDYACELGEFTPHVRRSVRRHRGRQRRAHGAGRARLRRRAGRRAAGAARRRRLTGTRFGAAIVDKSRGCAKACQALCRSH